MKKGQLVDFAAFSKGEQTQLNRFLTFRRKLMRDKTYSILTLEQEKEAAISARRGNLQPLVLHNLRFAADITYKKAFASGNPEFVWDLFAQAYLGLQKAARRFDETSGTKFITYAVNWIKQSMQEGLAELQGNDPGGKNAIAVPAYETDSPDFNLLLGERKEVVQIKLGKMLALSEREREIVTLYFGIGQTHSLTYEEIGERYSLPKERIKPIIEKALSRMRCVIRNRPEKF